MRCDMHFFFYTSTTAEQAQVCIITNGWLDSPICYCLLSGLIGKKVCGLDDMIVSMKVDISDE